MAKITVEFSKAEKLANGEYLFETTDGAQRTFGSVAEVLSFVESDILTTEMAWKFALGALLFREPNLIPNAQNKFAWLLSKAIDLEPVSDSAVVVR